MNNIYEVDIGSTTYRQFSVSAESRKEAEALALEVMGKDEEVPQAWAEGAEVVGIDVEIPDVNWHNVEIFVDRTDLESGHIDTGAVTLKANGREFILDVCSYYICNGSDGSIITCELTIDTKTFDECPFNLTKQDLLDWNHNDDQSATLYVTADDWAYNQGKDFKVEKIHLYYDISGSGPPEDMIMELEEEK